MPLPPPPPPPGAKPAPAVAKKKRNAWSPKPGLYAITGTKRGFCGGEGRPRMFKNGEELMDRYLEYCEWAAEQAFPVDKAFSTKRGIQHTSERRTGPKTLEGFQLFIPVVHKTFQQWERDRPDLTEAISLIRADIKDHKMRGAAAGVYSASIVGRELGLIDRASVEASFEPPVKRDKVNAEHHAIHVHPNDPDPLDLPRPLYSRAQLEAGIPFIPPDPKGG